jgi:hypothetical protein
LPTSKLPSAAAVVVVVAAVVVAVVAVAASAVAVVLEVVEVVVVHAMVAVVVSGRAGLAATTRRHRWGVEVLEVLRSSALALEVRRLRDGRLQAYPPNAATAAPL